MGSLAVVSGSSGCHKLNQRNFTKDKMQKTIFFVLTLGLVQYAAARCKSTVDCNAVVGGIPGVSLDTCPHVNSRNGTTPSGPQIPSEECCTDIIYYGPDPKHYYYDGSCPVYLKFTDVKLDSEEEIIIKNIYCENESGEDLDGCHTYVIDDTAITPFILPVSGSFFSLNTNGDGVEATFKIINEECVPGCCDPCGPMWTHHGGYCYYINYRLRDWDFHKNYCFFVHGGIIAPIYDNSTWTFLYDLAGAATWLGLHCKDDNNTQWYWNTPTGVPPAVNTLDYLWSPGYPLSSVNQHCAGFPFAPPAVYDPHLENTNCEAHFKSVCCRPLAS